MADGSKIEWTDATWNPITGCSVVSPGCTNCYAMKLAGTRLRNHPSRAGLTRDTKAGPVWTGEVRFNEGWLDQPLRWSRSRMIFVCAHGDLFAEGVPDLWLDQIFAVMMLARHHTFQVLTKRPERARQYLIEMGEHYADRRPGYMDRWGTPAADISGSPCAAGAIEDCGWPLPNVWLGVSAEDQRRADERVSVLLDTPAAVRWVSAEPLLGPIDFREWVTGREKHGMVGQTIAWLPPLDWIVVGGESGSDARPLSARWVRDIRDTCRKSDAAFHFKQWGEWAPARPRPSGTPGTFAFGDYEFEPDRMIQTDHFPREFTRFGARSTMDRVGKKSAGRMLDGALHDGFPIAAEVPFG